MTESDNSRPQDRSPSDRHNNAAGAAILQCSVLAWAGFAICVLLLQKHPSIRALLCPSTVGCDAVLSSKYSALAGIPLPWLGAGLYLCLFAILLFSFATNRRPVQSRLLNIISWITLIGAIFSVLLMYVQFGVLHAFCPLCTASALVMVSIVFTVKKAERIVATANFPGSRSGSLALGTVGLISMAILSVSGVHPEDEVIAVVDGQKFTRREMEDDLAGDLERLQRSIQSLEVKWVQKKVDSAILTAEAQKKKTTVEEMINARLGARGAISEKEVDDCLIQRGLSRIEDNIAFVRQELLSKRRELAIDELVGELAKDHPIEILLKTPRVRTLQIDLSTARVAGPANARIQLVVFSDFQCRFCAKLAPVLNKVRVEFPNDVLVAFRYFPLEINRRAVSAAIAAECAADQGAFWQYHDKLFAEGGDLSDAKLLSLAASIGLDQKRFQECLNSNTARKTVETSYKDAANSGLEGAPAVFIDGTMIGGGLDYDTLAKHIARRLHSSRNPASTRSRH